MSDETANTAHYEFGDSFPLVEGPASASVKALKRLDRMLERAVAQARVIHSQGSSPDPYRGLYVGDDEVDRVLSRDTAAPLFTNIGEGAGDDENHEEESRVRWLQRAFSLSAFDLDVVLIALAPEIDLRYERLYAYLQDDVTKKRPTIDLALNLLCDSIEAKIANRERFGADSPLVFHRLIHLLADPSHVQPPLLSHYLKLDDQIVRLVLEQDNLDARLAPFCRMIRPNFLIDGILVNDKLKRSLLPLVAHSRTSRQPLRLYFRGPLGTGKRLLAQALAAEVGVRLLVADLSAAHTFASDLVQSLKLLFREAWFQDAILYLDGLDVLLGDERSLSHQRLLELLQEHSGVTILSGVKPWVPSGSSALGVITIPFSIPDVTERRACWRAALASEGITLNENDGDVLADRFCLMPEQIVDAVVTARNYACWDAASGAGEETSLDSRASPELDHLYVAARAQCGHDLARLTQKIEPKYLWNDIVLPEGVLAQLREICQRVTHGHRVFGEWGFSRKLSIGKGINALFAGPSGTGKTMAAEIVANELGLELYKIDLSGVVSKYIGETEKNLDRIFTAAGNANAILFFDEADALFGKRSEVRDSHDRYANIEISYLLQKMEEYEGVGILATNLRQNLDESFTRRLAFVIHFPFPNDGDRRRIWTTIWPAEAPLAKDVDVDFLARQFKLSGGNIKNVALAASFLAAENGGVITMAHVVQATRREYQKLGKQLSNAELGLAASEVSV